MAGVNPFRGVVVIVSVGATPHKIQYNNHKESTYVLYHVHIKHFYTFVHTHTHTYCTCIKVDSITMLTVSRQFHSAGDGEVTVSNVVDLCVMELGTCLSIAMLIITSRSTPDNLHISDRVNGRGVFTEEQKTP